MNKEYYLVNGETQEGPYTLRELMQLDIDIYTEIITPQSDEPQYASNLPELIEYFEARGIYFPTSDNLASFGKRLAAFLIDYFGLYSILLAITVRTGLTKFPSNYVPGNPMPPDMIMLSYYMAIGFLIYKIICEGTNLKGTIGKKIFNLTVVDIDGKKPSIPRAFIRNLGLILSITIIWLPFLSIFFSEHRQAWYDSLAKTYVITTTPLKNSTLN